MFRQDTDKSLNQLQDCYVIGVPSKRLGEEVAAYVKLHENSSSTIEEILEHAAKGLARFKVPKYVKITGK